MPHTLEDRGFKQSGPEKRQTSRMIRALKLIRDRPGSKTTDKAIEQSNTATKVREISDRIRRRSHRKSVKRPTRSKR